MILDLVFALTSLSPSERSWERQQLCIESWRRAGLAVRSFNHPDEIAILSRFYDVEFVPVECTSIEVFGRHLVPVSQLLDWATSKDTQVLLINADIELRLSAVELRRLLLLSEKGLCCFVRYNESTDNRVCSKEPFGIDAFAVHGRDAAIFSASFLSLGQPFWDYWLPYAFEVNGKPLYFVDFPALFHQAHPQQWSWGSWHECALEFNRLTSRLHGNRSVEACIDMADRVRQLFEQRKLLLPSRPGPIRPWLEERFHDPAPKIFLELGAHCGSDTEWMAALPNVTMHAFEPDPRNCPPSLPNVTLHRAAVADRDGRVVFLLSKTGWGRKWTYSSSIKQPKNHLQRYPVTFGKTIEVDAITLDTFYAQHGLDIIDFIWADIQGAEGEMIRGGQRTLAHTRYLYTEFSDDELYEGQITLKDMLSLLPDFRVVELWPEDVLLKNENYVA